MDKIVECVPNFSEGRDRKVLNAIARAIESIPGVRLLDIDPDGDYNRSVFTFVGPPDHIVDAAFSAASAASEHIDMRRHSGGHPRMGAMDVAPFIPVSGVDMDDCIACARKFGKRAARELAIPVYLYESAATRPERRNLAQVRQGEYEGLEAKLADPMWKPDFGEAAFNARSGAIITGARKFLIAYNVNLDTDDLTVAKEIAFKVREIGRLKRDAAGDKIIGADGHPERIAGKLKCVKGLGVPMPERGIVQVSMNLTDFEITGLHQVFETCCNEAQSLGVRVSGSEVVGLVPKAAMLSAGAIYLEKLGLDEGADDTKRLSAAIEGLGLSDLYTFEPDKKVIELMIAPPE